MRKYNSKMKKTLIIISILFVGFIIVFSLFLKKAIDISKTSYTVLSGSILFDANYDKIVTSSEGNIKIKWGGDYYLVYNNENYKLGKNVVVYDSNNSDIHLYGKFYEVMNTSDVKVRKNETMIKSSVNSKFYKIDDRKYLIVDRTIESVDSSFVTSNYLIVNLDKTGNATLLNDKVSSKTLAHTKIRTSSYIFDINNETLNFGGENIDLKKIIGSTNIFDEDTYDLNADGEADDNDVGNVTSNAKDKSSSSSGGGMSTGTGASGTGTGASGTGTGASGTGGGSNGTGSGASGTGSGSNGTGGEANGSGGLNNADGTTSSSNSSYNNNYDSGISDGVVDEIIKSTRNTSVIRVKSGLNNISVDYVVYDPDNEYKSVYVEVENTNDASKKVVYLSKNDTHINIGELIPNVCYNLTFKYVYVDNNKNREDVFDEVSIFTQIPKMTLSTVKILDNKLYYKISINGNYNITGGSLSILYPGQNSELSFSIPTRGNTNEISGDDCFIDLSDMKIIRGTIVTLRISSISFNTYTIDPDVYYKFRY